MSFAFFDHTGDIGVRLDGRTLDDLFESAAAALTDSIVSRPSVEPRSTVEIDVESDALDLLLVDFLSEILYRFEVGQFLVARAHIQMRRSDAPGGGLSPPSAAAWRLHATLEGETFDAARHSIKVLVKAVTYHALEVTEEADGWHATVVFDI